MTISRCAIRASWRSYERWLASRGGAAEARPPMFLPFTLRGMTLVNRVVVSPMAQYSAVDGVPETGTWCTTATGLWGAPASSIPR